MTYRIIDLDKPRVEAIRGRVVIIYTGGTFGMQYDSQGVLVPFDFSEIMAQLPTMRKLALDITIVDFEKPIDSSDMAPDNWVTLVEIIANYYDQVDGFVILHGTDTMAYTASALSFMLEGLSKPVVFTGAQLPISEPRSDARENLITTLEIASAKRDNKPRVPEVCIYFGDELLRGNRSRKIESMEFDAFDSGNYPILAKAGVIITYNDQAIKEIESESGLHFHKALNNNVSVLKFFPGISPLVVRAALQDDLIEGLVLETYGSGNIPGNGEIFRLLEEAVKNDVVVVNVSQCLRGKVEPGRYASSKKLDDIGVVSGRDITTEAALTKLMVLLGENDSNTVRKLFNTPMAGEMSPW